MSKGLEAWLELAEWMIDYYNRVEHKEIEKDYFISDNGVEIEGIPTATITKELKALDIIKKYITIIHDDSLDETTNFKELWLLMFKSNWNYIDIPQEEYDLLKEVL